MNEYGTPVSFANDTGLRLWGEVRPRGSDWAVLTHTFGEDLDSVRPLDSSLADAGFSVLTFDLAGHGASEGEPSQTSTMDDLGGALSFALRNGAEYLNVVAVGSSGPAAIGMALRQPLRSLVLIEPVYEASRRLNEYRHSDASLRAPNMRAMIIATHGARSAKTFYSDLKKASPLLVKVPEDGQGLLRGPYRTQVMSHATGFLCQGRLHT